MGISNFDIMELVKYFSIPYFKGVFSRDELTGTPEKHECGIMNLNTSTEKGSHWVCYYKDENKRIYFDSFGQVIPTEIQRYLKTKEEFNNDEPVIQINTDQVQDIGTDICGHLCIYVLDQLSKGAHFQDIINFLGW